MAAPLNQVIFPVSFQELFAAWNRFPDAVLYAGGTNLIGKQSKNIISLPPVFICLDKIEELQRITRTEQYLEIGAMVNLNRLTGLGKIVPEILCACLENIAGPQVRNIATIGGNICSVSRLLDLPAILTALDAQYEFRGASNATRWVSAPRFHSKDHTILNEHELLTRIKLPLLQWDYAVYKKFYCEGYFNNETLAFLVKTQKNILSEIRVVYKGDSILRNKDAEDILNGKSLPLSRKTAAEFVGNWVYFLAEMNEVPELSVNSIINSIEENLYNLSE
ncbi:MAG: FAD binding domain-containing protein [Treponema sp.]|jgi:CO/xanthine dehydrogenase FAD-binding subunit|nr:FAD binding domain-containing protein [Treponema sp.]